MRLSPEILIRTRVAYRGQGTRRPDVPHVVTPIERYNDFIEKHHRVNQTAPVNNFPWKWRKPELTVDTEQHF